MHGLGARGIRFNLAQAGATTPEMVEPLSKRVNELGWHIQINAPAAKIMEIMPILQRVPSLIVFDHLAHIPEPDGINHPLFGQIRALIDKGRTWVKLSGAYADTKIGPPTYADSTAVAQAYVKAAPERLVWTGRTLASGRKSPTMPYCSISCWPGRQTKLCATHPGREPGHSLRLSEERLRALRFAQAEARYSFLAVAVVSIFCGVTGCTPTNPVKAYAEPAPRTEAIYVISGGWHTELGLRLDVLSGRLAALKPDFPDARYLVFGWGARDYYMSQDPGIGDFLRAAASGPAVMLVIPLQMSPEEFFGASNVFVLPAPREGIQRLSEFLWRYLVNEQKGILDRVGTGPYPQSMFYASTGTYNLGHTCNTWTAEALHVAGLPVNAAGVIFAGQVLDQLPPIIGTKTERIQ
jgi:uncharacterized protein (TIGR02117 family)